MRSKLFILAATLSFSVLTGCEWDTDTPASLKRDSYYDAKMKAANQTIINCSEAQIVLPKSNDSETLGVYILQIHAANHGALANMDLTSMQNLYRSCLRPAILNRIRED